MAKTKGFAAHLAYSVTKSSELCSSLLCDVRRAALALGSDRRSSELSGSTCRMASVEIAAEHERILREIESTDTNCIGPTLRWVTASPSAAGREPTPRCRYAGGSSASSKTLMYMLPLSDSYPANFSKHQS